MAEGDAHGYLESFARDLAALVPAGGTATVTTLPEDEALVALRAPSGVGLGDRVAAAAEVLSVIEDLSRPAEECDDAQLAAKAVAYGEVARDESRLARLWVPLMQLDLEEETTLWGSLFAAQDHSRVWYERRYGLPGTTQAHLSGVRFPPRGRAAVPLPRDGGGGATL